MRDRNETTSETPSADLVPIPIGLVPLIHVVKMRTLSSRSTGYFMLGLHTKTVMAWKPKELHKFWRRMLGDDETKG